MSAKLLPFSYFGGKFSSLSFLLPLLPPADHFVDVFGGSAAVLLNRSPSSIETYNDLDGRVVNFFRVLRDRGEELFHALSLTPYSRREFEESLIPSDDPLEDARRFFTAMRQSYGGTGPHHKSPSWGWIKSSSRMRMASNISKMLSAISLLPEVVERIQTWQIENRDAFELIPLLDTPRTLFYLDPPYLSDVREKNSRRVYFREWNTEDHIRLAELLHRIVGMAAISGYDSPLYRNLYSDWVAFRGPTKAIASGSHPQKTEMLWTNYDFLEGV